MHACARGDALRVPAEGIGLPGKEHVALIGEGHAHSRIGDDKGCVALVKDGEVLLIAHADEVGRAAGIAKGRCPVVNAVVGFVAGDELPGVAVVGGEFQQNGIAGLHAIVRPAEVDREAFVEALATIGIGHGERRLHDGEEAALVVEVGMACVVDAQLSCCGEGLAYGQVPCIALCAGKLGAEQCPVAAAIGAVLDGDAFPGRDAHGYPVDGVAAACEIGLPSYRAAEAELRLPDAEDEVAGIADGVIGDVHDAHEGICRAGDIVRNEPAIAAIVRDIGDGGPDGTAVVGVGELHGAVGHAARFPCDVIGEACEPLLAAIGGGDKAGDVDKFHRELCAVGGEVGAFFADAQEAFVAAGDVRRDLPVIAAAVAQRSDEGPVAAVVSGVFQTDEGVGREVAVFPEDGEGLAAVDAAARQRCLHHKVGTGKDEFIGTEVGCYSIAVLPVDIGRDGGEYHTRAVKGLVVDVQVGLREVERIDREGVAIAGVGGLPVGKGGLIAYPEADIAAAGVEVVIVGGAQRGGAGGIDRIATAIVGEDVIDQVDIARSADLQGAATCGAAGSDIDRVMVNILLGHVVDEVETIGGACPSYVDEVIGDETAVYIASAAVENDAVTTAGDADAVGAHCCTVVARCDAYGFKIGPCSSRLRNGVATDTHIVLIAHMDRAVVLVAELVIGDEGPRIERAAGAVEVEAIGSTTDHVILNALSQVAAAVAEYDGSAGGRAGGGWRRKQGVAHGDVIGAAEQFDHAAVGAVE